jgi:hypothetical protein
MVPPKILADFFPLGKTYVAFPDALTRRIPLKEIAKEDIRERLRLVWTDPLSLDPSKKSAKVTREVTEKLRDSGDTIPTLGSWTWRPRNSPTPHSENRTLGSPMPPVRFEDTLTHPVLLPR